VRPMPRGTGRCGRCCGACERAAGAAGHANVRPVPRGTRTCGRCRAAQGPVIPVPRGPGSGRRLPRGRPRVPPPCPLPPGAAAGWSAANT
jgi:hypothetical protein